MGLPIGQLLAARQAYEHADGQVPKLQRFPAAISKHRFVQCVATANLSVHGVCTKFYGVKASLLRPIRPELGELRFGGLRHYSDCH
jgi:hypothetical protein